jgi:hypothetical protein
MKWFIVVIFMQDYGSFIFFKPQFESSETCLASATNPSDIAVYGARIVMEYGRPLPVDRIICANEDVIKEMMTGSKSERI